MIETTMTAPTTLVLRHTVNAPQERVYTAWTTPEIMKTFMAPEGVSIGKISADARVGGAYSIEMLDTPGGAMTVRGTYTELHPYDRIAFTWKWDEENAADEHESTVSLEFVPNGDKTDIVLTHANLKDSESRDRHAKGWTSILENLGTLS